MKISVHYFALLRDERGLESEILETQSANAGALYSELAAQHGFALPQGALKVAVNDSFSSWDQPLAEGDSVAFIPPVAGG